MLEWTALSSFWRLSGEHDVLLLNPRDEHNRFGRVINMSTVFPFLTYVGKWPSLLLPFPFSE